MHTNRQRERIHALKLAAAMKRSQTVVTVAPKVRPRAAAPQLTTVKTPKLDSARVAPRFRPISSAEAKKAQLWLCDRPHDVLRLTGNLCCETGVLDRDSTVRLFYHSVLPYILSKKQSSHLLLYLCRRSRAGVAESWHEETTFFETLRPQGDIILENALKLLQEAVDSNQPYALRVVVEAPGSGAHALLLLLQGTRAWLVDPNGDFGMVHLYFGSRETLVIRIEEILHKVGCQLSIPQLPSLHAPDGTSCLQEYCRGGACTFVTGVVAIRALESGNPELVLRKLAAGVSRPKDLAKEVDELVALTIACHVVSEKCTRQDLRSRICQLALVC